MDAPEASVSVVHLQRRPIPGFHSVERLFEDVREELRESGVQIHARINQFASRGVLPRIRDAFAARRHQAQVNHVTGDVHYLAWWLDPARTVLTVLDCVSLSRIHGLRRVLFKYLWYTLPVRRSRYVTVISEFTRRELLLETACHPAKVIVIYPHLSEEFVRVDREFNQARPRVLQIGTTPNKNIERLVAALAGLNIELTIVGELDASQRAAIKKSQLAVIEKTRLTRAQILEEYAATDIVAFVSTYEGFGLPIIEAQAVGRVVVTSDRCSMPEVAADAACIVDPTSIADIRSAFQRIIQNPDLRADLIARGFKNVQRFRLKAIGAQYAELYRKVATQSAQTTAGQWQSAH